MSKTNNIWFFFITTLSLLVAIFQFGMETESGDKNAASMYVLVFGFLSFLFWGVSFFFMITLKSYFIRKRLSVLSVLLPSIIFIVSFYFVSEVHKQMILLLSIVSTIINIIFYFISSFRLLFK